MLFASYSSCTLAFFIYKLQFTFALTFYRNLRFLFVGTSWLAIIVSVFLNPSTTVAVYNVLGWRFITRFTALSSIVIEAFQADEDPLSSKYHHHYRFMIGAMSCLYICTHPDIIYFILALSRFLHDPCYRDLSLCRRVLRYIPGTLDYELYFSSSINLNFSSLAGFVDTDLVEIFWRNAEL